MYGNTLISKLNAARAELKILRPKLDKLQKQFDAERVAHINERNRLWVEIAKLTGTYDRAQSQ